MPLASEERGGERLTAGQRNYDHNYLNVWYWNGAPAFCTIMSVWHCWILNLEPWVIFTFRTCDDNQVTWCENEGIIGGSRICIDVTEVDGPGHSCKSALAGLYVMPIVHMHSLPFSCHDDVLKMAKDTLPAAVIQYAIAWLECWRSQTFKSRVDVHRIMFVRLGKEWSM